MEEFSDFQCPYCSKAYPIVEQLLKDYGDKLTFVYKQFPLTSIHPFAEKAAEASECARDQGKFKEYYDKLFTNQNALAVDDLKRYAKDLSLDTSKFNTCLDNNEKVSVVQKDLQEGQSRGVGGTPTFFINGQKLVGAQPIENFKSIIDAQSFHPNAEPAAEAAECADEQGKFWEYHDKLFANQGTLSTENYRLWATELGLDSTKFNDCIDQKKYSTEIQKDFQDGQAAGISGTPGFIIGVLQPDGKTVKGQIVKGAYPLDYFKTVIEAELTKV